MSNTLSLLVEEANSAMQAQDLALAESKFNQALEQQGDFVDALYGLGTVKIQTNDLEAARILLSQAAEIEPEAADIALNHGFVLAKLGLRAPALLELQRATKYCGNDFVLCGTIAELFVSLGESVGALQLLDRLEALSPNDQVVMARAHGLNNNWAESVRILHRLSNELPKDATVLGELASAAARMRDYRVAVDTFERLLKVINPTAWDYVKFADLLLLAKQPERAEQAIKLAEDAGESSQDLNIIKSKLARLNADYSKANEAADAALASNSLNGQAWFIKAELCNESDSESLLTKLEEVMNDQDAFAQQSFHQQSMLYFAAARLAQNLQNTEMAASCLRQANNIRMEELRRTHQVYNSDLAESKTSTIIELFTADVMEKRGATKDTKFNLTPIFIVGMPRSGTTLVEKILGRNKQVQVLGEQDAMTFVAAEYEHARARGEVGKPEDVKEDQWQAMRQTYLDKISDLTKPIFTDKLPHNFQNVGLILKLFPEAKVIQLRRDAKDTAFSIYENPFALEHSYASWLVDSLHAVGQAERLMDHWASLHSPQIMDLHYESLVQNPNYYGELITSFCGLNWTEEMLQPTSDDQNSYTFSELQSRQPVNTSRVGRWKAYAEYLPELKQA